jgi:hypothetical protein
VCRTQQAVHFECFAGEPDTVAASGEAATLDVFDIGIPSISGDATARMDKDTLNVATLTLISVERRRTMHGK